MKNYFWKNKKVLITGVNGFVGAHLADKLQKEGAIVTGLIRNQKKKTYLFIEKIDKKINLIRGDITDHAFLKKNLIEQEIEICFHLAAQVEVGLARKFPYLTWETNIKGTYSLLEAVRECGDQIKSVIIASSDKAYGDYPRNKMPYKEEYVLKPIYPYDVSKACADIIAKSYSSNLFNLPVVTTRFSNIFGPGQVNFSALIPDYIRSLLDHGKFSLRGNGKSVRDFLYITDVIELYLLIAKKLYFKADLVRGHAFNAGTNSPKEIKKVIKIIHKVSNSKKDLSKVFKNIKKNKTKGEIDFQFMDYKKVKKFFGWRPRSNFDLSIKETFNWYKKNITKI